MVRARIGHWLRRWADRIDYLGAPRLLNWTFTLEAGEGIRFRMDGRGCRLAYLGVAEYEKAHAEADSASEDIHKAEDRRLIEIGMTEPDPKKAEAAMAELNRRMLAGMRGADA